MTGDGNFSGCVALLIAAGLGLVIAGAVLSHDALPCWLMGGGWAATWLALGAYSTSARRRLDPRDSERRKVTP